MSSVDLSRDRWMVHLTEHRFSGYKHASEPYNTGNPSVIQCFEVQFDRAWLCDDIMHLAVI